MRKLIGVLLVSLPLVSFGFDRGIYITAAMATHPEFIEKLI
jgi:hypothetical protein